MKSTTGSNRNAISKNLHQLVSGAAGNSIRSAVERNSFIVNEVPPQFQVETDQMVLASLLNNLLGTIVTHTKNSCIRIKAQEYEDILFISIRDNSGYGNYAQSDNLDYAKLLAKKMNGNIIIRNLEDKFTNILLSFPNIPGSA